MDTFRNERMVNVILVLSFWKGLLKWAVTYYLLLFFFDKAAMAAIMQMGFHELKMFCPEALTVSERNMYGCFSVSRLNYCNTSYWMVDCSQMEMLLLMVCYWGLSWASFIFFNFRGNYWKYWVNQNCRVHKSGWNGKHFMLDSGSCKITIN